MQLLLQRREVRQAPRSFKDERRHASSARRARRRQSCRSEQSPAFASASRRAARKAPRGFNDERRHACSARRAHRRQGRKSGQIQSLLQRREVRQAPRSFEDERRHVFSARRARRRQGRKSLFMFHEGENFASASRSAAGAAELQRRASPRLLGTAGSQTTRSQEPFQR